MPSAWVAVPEFVTVRTSVNMPSGVLKTLGKDGIHRERRGRRSEGNVRADRRSNRYCRSTMLVTVSRVAPLLMVIGGRHVTRVGPPRGGVAPWSERS